MTGKCKTIFGNRSFYHFFVSMTTHTHKSLAHAYCLVQNLNKFQQRMNHADIEIMERLVDRANRRRLASITQVEILTKVAKCSFSFFSKECSTRTFSSTWVYERTCFYRNIKLGWEKNQNTILFFFMVFCIGLKLSSPTFTVIHRNICAFSLPFFFLSSNKLYRWSLETL